MPTKHLPDRPQLDHLRNQAKSLQRAVRGGDTEANQRVEDCYPGGLPADHTGFGLSEAQLVVAREYGFSSWTRLKRYLQTVADFSWELTPRADGTPADEFCRLACLTYSHEDGPDRWGQARAILAEQPGLTADHVWAAAAAADLTAVQRLIEAEPALAGRRGGPHRWTPMFYLAYSRLDPEVPADRVLGIARLLRDHGADPNEGYLWNGGPYAFTVLTGAFGEGEQGPTRQPRHPHSLQLARLLLEAGADPVDDQTLYNRMFRPDDDHLQLLFEYGLGRGDQPGPWRERMTDLHADPATKLRVQLRWAIEHGFADRVRLLAGHAVDVQSPYEDGRTPLAIAELYGGPAVIEALREAGAERPVPDNPADALVAAVFRADPAAVQTLVRDHPDAAEAVRRGGRNLLPWAAAASGREETIRLLVELGLDVNALGRSDVPVDGGWIETGWGQAGGERGGHTALHEAAYRGDAGLVRTLLDLGADAGRHDTDHDATPLGWAQYAEQQGEDREAVIELLRPLTTA
ncbi:ankyrin repeat domain-containing protein [Microlunatus speluncae]|uniref:ankyrin repeat domain-containing protein n=1 Tax=Microlunatus speluncae TaxID=2594267 RepID=UPI0012663E53|nr:ankyrin repeat domain-containing protein [Microlunatus speluncae]